MTHTSTGMPVVTEEIATKFICLPVNDIEDFKKKSAILIKRIEEENPNLAKAIASMSTSMTMISGPNPAKYLMDCIFQILMMLEEADSIYREG